MTFYEANQGLNKFFIYFVTTFFLHKLKLIEQCWVTKIEVEDLS
jgi:hypothetical protein